MAERLQNSDYAIDIYNTFARVKRKLISNIDGCVDFKDDFGVKDITITDKQGNVLMYDNYVNDDNNGKSIIVTTSNNEKIIGRLVSMDHDRITLTVNFKKMIIYNPISYLEDNPYNCRLIVPQCPNCDDLILTYTTELIRWESQIILTFRKDETIDILHIANISNDGTLMLDPCDVNLIASNILITETQNQYVRALTANTNMPSKDEDVNIIPLGIKSLFAKNHKLFINKYDVPKDNYVQIYMMDNQSYDVYLGYKIYSPLLIPSSTMLAFKEYEINNNKDVLFIGKNQVDETRPLSPFYIKLVQTSVVTYSFNEFIDDDKDTQFRVTLINKNETSENVVLKYYLRGRIPTRIITKWKYTLYNDYIIFEGQIDAVVMKKKLYFVERAQIIFSFQN